MQISSPLPQTVSIQSHLPRREANYIEATAVDEVIMSEEASSRCLVLFADSDTPVVLPVPRTVDEFQQEGIHAGSKRIRTQADSSQGVEPTRRSEQMRVEGVEESNGEPPATLPRPLNTREFHDP